MSWKSHLVVIAMTALVATAATRKIQSWRWQSELANVTIEHQAEISAKDKMLQAMKDEASRQLQAQQAQQQEQAKRIATLDAKHYKELRHAQNEATRFRTDLAAGRLRLYVDIASPANSAGRNSVPGNSEAAHLDDGNIRTELHPEIATRLVSITSDADECARKLTGLQQWFKQ